MNSAAVPDAAIQVLDSSASRPRSETANVACEPRPSIVDIDSTFLPIAQMRQISRVTELAGASIVGEVDLGTDHWVYDQHFPGDPIFPGSLLIEAAGQLVALWAWARGHRGRPRLVRATAEFKAPVARREPRLVLHGDVISRRHLQFATVLIRTEEAEVATVTAVLAVLPDDRTPAPSQP